MSWMWYFNNIGRASRSHNCNTPAQQKSTSHELTHRILRMKSSGLHDGSQYYCNCSDIYSNSPSPSINRRSDERNRNHTSDRIHWGDNASPRAVVLDFEISLELIFGKKGVEHRSIKSIACWAEESNQRTNVENKSSLWESFRRFLEHGLIECLIAFHDLDLRNIVFELWSVY